MLDRMIIVRGGVGVTAGTATMLPGVADSTTLYWSHRRKYRPTRDLSHGWGSNSQWRTQFRRDYDLGTIHYFNVDGRNQLSELPSSRDEVTALTKAERIELLVNRCFVGRAEPQADLWPYDDTFQIQLHERTNYGF